MRFNKPAYTPEQHIDLLKVRGLTFPDEERAKRYLLSIGYYRLSAYFRPYQYKKDTFREGATFSEILDLYIFDRKLRLHVMDALERIEVAIRSVISDNLCNRYTDPHWYLQEDVFVDAFLIPEPPRNKSQYEVFKNKIKFHTGKNNHGNRNPSCSHYYDVYTEPELPPSWMVIEVLPMGTWSVIFENIRKAKVRQKISKFFSFKTNDFGGWLHALTLIRNNCAHHNRFWNATFPPKARDVVRYTHAGIPLNTPYANLAMIHAFLTSFTKHPKWSERLFELLQECPLDVHAYIAFPDEWEKIPFWRITP